MLEDIEKSKKVRLPKKITKQRLKNIALYYLKRFDSSIDNLRQVLKRRVLDYAYHNPEWNKSESLEWIEEILSDFEGYGYLNDERFAEIKVNSYLSSSKSARYIVNKLKAKGISESVIDELLEKHEYDAFSVALDLARKKKIGPYRAEEQRKEFRQKDIGVLIRAGFEYDVVMQVLAYEV